MYKAAVIGAGFIGAAHVEALRRLGNVEIAALCDAFGAEEKAEQMNIPRAYSDYRKMLDELELDAIHICTPNHTHYEIAKCAIEHGVNFICEKPFTTTLEQAKELVALAEEKHVKGMVNFHNRIYPMTNQIHQMVKSGELGRIFSIHGEYVQDWLQFETDYSWRLESNQCGPIRAVADIGSHWMDLAEFVSGTRVRRVCASFSTVYPVRKKPTGKVETFGSAGADASYVDVPIDTEDQAAILFEFENGAIGTLMVSQVFAGRKNTMVINVAGSKKSAMWTSEDLNNLLIGYREKPNEIMAKDPGLLSRPSAANSSYPGGHIEGFPDAFKHAFRQFYASLSGEGEYDYATLRDGLRETQLCEATLRSAQTGGWVDVSQEA